MWTRACSIVTTDSRSFGIMVVTYTGETTDRSQSLHLGGRQISSRSTLPEPLVLTALATSGISPCAGYHPLRKSLYLSQFVDGTLGVVP